MLILAIAGLWAMWRGSITITESLSLQGRRARMYGATLFAVAAVLSVIGPFLAPFEPDLLQKNDAARIASDFVFVASVVVGLVFPFRRPGEPR